MWGPWKCSRECKSLQQVRYRYCDDPQPANGGKQCLGERVNKKEALCNAEIKCPEDCLDYEWGMNCLNGCTECLTACSKFNGSCLSCKAGYKDARHGCNLVCDLFEYGIDCKGDCRITCLGQDCQDRVSGECKREST
uniref:Uncharacterized protein n=1 Tax=Biomphalaria glabrata TaxID=6526 RepID=A0A2C9LD14_BIOGL